jgi:hypothetical protein
MKRKFSMRFNEHSDLAGQHAFLSPSGYHWINYDALKLTEVYRNSQMAKRGIELHAFAHRAIQLGQKLPKSGKTLNRYVNDAIGFRMTTEQILYYSRNCFGHADTICFGRDRELARELLRVHDLKTGVNPGSMHQLEVYASIFCLEYGFKADEIAIELRIYQNDEVVVSIPEPEIITGLMNIITIADRQIESMRAEVQ